LPLTVEKEEEFSSFFFTTHTLTYIQYIDDKGRGRKMEGKKRRWKEMRKYSLVDVSNREKLR